MVAGWFNVNLATEPDRVAYTIWDQGLGVKGQGNTIFSMISPFHNARTSVHNGLIPIWTEILV